MVMDILRLTRALIRFVIRRRGKASGEEALTTGSAMLLGACLVIAGRMIGRERIRKLLIAAVERLEASDLLDDVKGDRDEDEDDWEDEDEAEADEEEDWEDEDEDEEPELEGEDDEPEAEEQPDDEDDEEPDEDERERNRPSRNRASRSRTRR